MVATLARRLGDLHYIERIETLDRRLNSVVTMDLDSARAAAEAADVAAARREWLGPLHGLPVTIKDAIEVRGMRSTGGAVELGRAPAGRAGGAGPGTGGRVAGGPP